MNFDFDRFSRIAASVYTSESPYSLEDVLGVFKCYFQQYEAYTGHSHPPLRASQVARIIQDMPWLDCVCRGSVSADITPDCYPVIIEQHCLLSLHSANGPSADGPASKAERG